jgi:hypothetical protein
MALHALNADFPGPAPEPGPAAERIVRLKDRGREAAECAVVLVPLLVATIVWNPPFIAPIGAGLLGALVVAVLSQVFLTDLLDECAMYPCMSRQPDIADRQRRLVEPDQLRELALALRKLTDERTRTVRSAGVEDLVIRARVRAVRPRLLQVADALEREQRADPVAVARLWMLLRSGIASPLYNTTLAADELDVILRQALWRMLDSDRRVPVMTRPSDD